MYSVQPSAARQAKADAFFNYIIKRVFEVAKPLPDHNSTLVLQVDAWLADKQPLAGNVLDELIASGEREAVQFTRSMDYSLSQADLNRVMAKLTNELERDLTCEVTTTRVLLERYGMCTQVEFISETLDTAVYLTFSLQD